MTNLLDTAIVGTHYEFCAWCEAMVLAEFDHDEWVCPYCDELL